MSQPFDSLSAYGTFSGPLGPAPLVEEAEGPLWPQAIGIVPFGSLTPFGVFTVAVAPATLRQAILHHLRQSVDVVALVGQRISAQAVPQLSTLPALTFSLPAVAPGRNLGGADGTARATARISAWARTQGECDRAAEAVRNRWDGFRGFIGDVDVMGSFVGENVDLPEPPATPDDQWLYHTLITISLVYRVPIPDQLET